LPYNIDVFCFNELKQDGLSITKAQLSREMISDTLVSEGINFNIGPRKNGGRNAVSCRARTSDYRRAIMIGCISWLARPTATQRLSLWWMARRLHCEFRIGAVSSAFGTIAYLNSSSRGEFCGSQSSSRILPGYIKRQPLAWFQIIVTNVAVRTRFTHTVTV
jgi:hypothetical protein